MTALAAPAISEKASGKTEIEMSHLQEDLDRDFDPSALDLQVELYKKAFADHARLSRAEQSAHGLSAFLNKKNIRVKPSDLFAGHLQFPDCSQSVPFFYTADRTKRPRSSPYTGGIKSARIFNESALGNSGRTLTGPEEDTLDIAARGTDCGLFVRGAVGHTIPGFERVVHLGYAALKAQLHKALRTPGKSAGQRAYLRGMKIIASGMGSFILRYADAAGDMLRSVTTEKEQKQLRRIRDACRRLAAGPAQTFFDALQAVLLLQEAITTETLSGSLSLGRLDRLFYPYYQAELEAGTITARAAEEMVDTFRLKFAGMANAYQNITIGGCDGKGSFAGNAISLMFMRSAKRLRLEQPLLSLRCTRDMPDEFWQEALSLIALGDGLPALFNDDVVIQSRLHAGVQPEDAWNYGIVGCVEPCIGGKEFSNTEELRLNWAKVLELMLNNGRCRITDEQFPLSSPRPLDSIESYEDFLAWYKEELIYYLRIGIETCNLVDAAYFKDHPSPLLSLTMEGCIRNARDAAGGGTKYNLSTINNCGMANVVDSLIAIRQLVFEKKMVTLSRLNDVLNCNFIGFENIRAFALNRCEKFGNALEEPDSLMRELTDLAVQTITLAANSRGARFQAGMYSVNHHAAMGSRTGATPDGRLARTSLVNALCPVQGADVSGPTAVIRSVSRCDHARFSNGVVLDMKFSPAFFREGTGKEAFKHMVKTGFALGCMEMQFNVVDRATLLAAKEHPEDYRNLIVRVSGFSAYFVTLDPVLQDEIIARTAYEGTG